MQHLPLLPIGQQDFGELRRTGRLYVDKTTYVYQLLNHRSVFFFLARPRRFGKSLLVSTLKCIFEGKKELFEGLYIYDKIDWNQTHPIVHLDFSRIDFRGKGLRKAINDRLDDIAVANDVPLKENHIAGKFDELMKKLHRQTGRQAVILIDEYDKPITDVLEVGKNEKAHEHREILRELYSVVKGSSEHIRFFFMTGIARFSKVSLFSDLNNLTDLSSERDFHNLLGYTQQELESNFTAHLDFIARERSITQEALLEKIKYWYNGFSWNGRETLYNPYSILRFLSAREFRNFWFDSGTPKFLIELLKKQMVYDISRKAVSPLMTENFDIDNLNLYTLLFQTGYLTLAEEDELGFYILDYPNKEVEQALLEYIITAFSNSMEGAVLARRITLAIRSHDMEELMRTINVLFASIPYPIFDRHQEKYFHAVLFLAFKLCGFFVQAEVAVSTGRIDAVMSYENRVYIFEFKLNDTAENALQQIKEQGYYKSFVGQTDKEVFLLGISFSGQTKEVAEWKMEKL
jgi:predicted DNA-binding ribbon-helix-helix protein